MSKSSTRQKIECVKNWITIMNISKPKVKKVVKPLNTEKDYE